MIKVIHILYQSVPDVSGSSTRSKSIVDAQLGSGEMIPVIVTSPLQVGLGSDSIDVIDGIKYYRTYAGNADFAINRKKSLLVKAKKALSFVGFYRTVCRVIEEERPQVVHAHAIFACGLVGLLAARRYGLPFVYEMRSDWHLDENFDSGTFFQKLFGGIERFLARRADALVVISQGLMEKYGPLNTRPVLVPNGVHQNMVRPLGPGGALTATAGGGPNPTFGFIGSLIPLEGLAFVVDALARLRTERGIDARMIIAGRGEEQAKLEVLARERGVTDLIEFTGAVPFAQVSGIYDRLDVIINFRRDEPIAHSVTPLKPLEAMAQRKLVVVSSVRGMQELVTGGRTGLVVPAEDVNALMDTIELVHRDFSRFQPVIDAGYAHVTQNRTWPSLVGKYTQLYRQLCTH